MRAWPSRFGRHRVALLAAALLILIADAGAGAAPAAQTANPDISALFGSRVAAKPGYPKAYVSADFDGDRKPDAVHLVTIAPASRDKTLAKDVTTIDTLWGTPPLGNHGEALALAIVLSSGKKRFLIASYGENGSGYFDSPIWQSKPLPIDLAPRGSKTFREFAKQEKRIKNDVLVLGTEAGIDTALYWDGMKFVLFAPPEEP